MKIRPATPDDALPLARLHVAAWRAAYRGLVPDEFLDGLDVDARTARFRPWLAAGEAENHVAEEDGELWGWLTVDGCRDPDLDPQATGEIWGIYLAPAHWRQGLGRTLCRYGEEILRSRDYAVATLWVLGGNERARRFYEAMGSFADGASKSLDFGVPLEAVRYRKALGVEPAKPEGPPWPRMHIRAGLVLTRPALERESGRGCPMGSCDRHSPACPVLVMAHSGRSCCGFLTSCLARTESSNVLLGQDPSG